MTLKVKTTLETKENLDLRTVHEVMCGGIILLLKDK